MKPLRFLAFSLAIGTAALTSYGQGQAVPKDQPKLPSGGVPRTAPKAPSNGAPEVPKAPGVGVPKSPGNPGVTPPKSPQAGSTEPPKPRTGPGEVSPPKSPRAGDSPTPKLPRSGNPDLTPPKSPRANDPTPGTPRPKTGADDIAPPKSPRANDPDAGLSKPPRAGSPDADAPKLPRSTTPDRGQKPPATSNETRKPMLPETDKTPGKSGLDPAPQPGASEGRTPRTDRPDATRPRDNASDKPDTPSRRPDPADRPSANDRTNQDRPDNDRPNVNRPNVDRPGADRPNTDRPNARELDQPRGKDRSRDADQNRNAERNRDANRDADRNDIPSGFTKAPDRNARETTERPVKQFRVDPRELQNDPSVSAAFKNLQNVRSADQLNQAFSSLRDSGRDGRLGALNLDHVSGRFQTRVGSNDFDTLVQSRIGQRFNLNRQFSLYAQGDVARQLNLNVNLVNNGGWQSRYVGPIYPGYTRLAYSAWYPGPQWYPAYTWMPQWSPWVQWSFWNNVLPIYDPRPFVVRPIIYDAAPVITTYEYPTWQELPVVTSGTWIDVPPVSVASGQDLQLLAVRFVDPGHMDEDLGPRYRVWLRNNAKETLDRSFDVTAFASGEKELSDQVVQAGVTVPEIAGDDTIAVDIRLPADANRLVTEDNDVRVPFKYLHVVVDSRNSTREQDKENNGALLKRGDIFPVDPAAFSTDVTAAAPGSTITIAGEGLGPEPGEVIISIGEAQHPATVRGWYDLGIQIEVPDLDLREAVDAQVLVVRGDGAASNPVPLSIAPEESIGMLPPAPAPER